jgi:hypothetical protein
MSDVTAIKILCRMDFPSSTVRLWSGSEPYIDVDGYVWRSCRLDDAGLDAIEAAVNGETVTLSLALEGVDPQISDIAWQETEAGDVIGAIVQILAQDVDAENNPIDAADVLFTGTIDNIQFGDSADANGIRSSISIECVNRFALRTQTSGRVLSAVDQRARSAVLNLGANPDEFCDRTPGLAEKVIRWPNW